MKRNKGPRLHGVRSLKTLPGERVGGLTMRLLPVPREPYRVSLLHEKLAPFSTTPAIYHKLTTEFAFILKGRATVRLDGRRIPIKAGDIFEIPAGTEHQFVTKKEGVEAISLFSPPLDPENNDAHPGKDPKTGLRFPKRALTRQKLPGGPR